MSNILRSISLLSVLEVVYSKLYSGRSEVGGEGGRTCARLIIEWIQTRPVITYLFPGG